MVIYNHDRYYNFVHVIDYTPVWGMNSSSKDEIMASSWDTIFDLSLRT